MQACNLRRGETGAESALVAPASDGSFALEAVLLKSDGLNEARGGKSDAKF